MKRRQKCRKCKGKEFRKSGVHPSSYPTSRQSKGYAGPPGRRCTPYSVEAITRLFARKYACLNCGHRMRLKR